jgi:hypothetical protein
MVALFGSTSYSAYIFSKEYHLLLNKDCYQVLWANLVTSLFVWYYAITILYYKLMNQKIKNCEGSLLIYLLANAWCITLFCIMNEDCTDRGGYCEKNHEYFWRMRTIIQNIVFVIVLININVLFNDEWEQESFVDLVDMYFYDEEL